MDQLKEFLGVLRRQHFWFIAPLLLVIGLVGWMMANKQLTEKFEARKTAVKGYISQMQSVSSQEPHPNEEYEVGMQQLIEQRRENVRAAWSRKWEQQRRELSWPERLAELAPDFIARVEPLRPIEKHATNVNVLHSRYRQLYEGFIKQELPVLAEKIGARWEPSNSNRVTSFGNRASERFSGGAREPRSRAPSSRAGVEEPPPLVEWNPRNQAEIEDLFTWPQPPTTLEVLYAQEDLWVLTTLIDIIQRTNGDAKIPSQAAIKAIDYIQFGKTVKPPSQQGFRVVRPVAVEDGEAEGSASESPSSTGSESAPDFGTIDHNAASGSPEVLAEGTAPNPLLELVKNRYYDMNYQPIADLESPSLKVAKRIPVRLRVRMDQRRINELLVQCANADLTFEVRQLRFDPQGEAPGDVGEQPNASGLFRPSSGTNKSLRDSYYQSLDRTVELFGIVYIFNPVDDAVLNGEVGTESVPPEEAEASLPADRRAVQLAMSP